MLEGRADRGPGLGLGAFKLILLFNVGSVAELEPPGFCKLLGLDVLLTAPALGAGAALGGAWPIIFRAGGFTNMPRPISQVKYRLS